MSSKIRVDPRTFKIINNSQPQPQPQPTPTITSESELSSDSDSLTSVNSNSNTVKVIKLDNSMQYGGFSNPQQQKLIQPQTQTQTQPQPQTQPQQKQQQDQQKQQQDQQKPPQILQKQQPENQKQPVQQSNNNLESYLKNTTTHNDDNEYLNNNNTENDTDNNSVPETVSVAESETVSEKLTTEGQQTQDVFDLTQNKLYQVLSALFEDSKGNNISQNMVKFCELFEKQNQTMEKILNQLVIMNSNYNKQIKIPESLQTNTKPAGSITDFRKRIEEIKKEEIK